MKHHEWLTRNSLRSFPVMEDARSVSSLGWTLDPGLVVDASLAGDLSCERVCIQSVTITPKICSVVIGDPVTGDSLAYASVVIGNDPVFVQKPLLPLNQPVGGHVSFGPSVDPRAFKLLPQGFHDFGNLAILESRTCLMTGEFPVRSLALPNGVTAMGDVVVDAGDSLDVAVSTDESGVDPVQYAVLSLKNPSQFLSPCEEKTTSCDCASTPIRLINGIPGNDDGTFFIEIEDENGNIYLLDEHTLSFLITRTGENLCNRVKVPDIYGRLPGPSGAYTHDLPPLTAYNNPADLSFPLPIL